MNKPEWQTRKQRIDIRLRSHAAHNAKAREQADKLTPSVPRLGSGSMLVAVLLAPHQVNDGQDADGIEDGDADEPGELIVARALPHADGFPDAIPDGEQNNYGDQQD